MNALTGQALARTVLLVREVLLPTATESDVLGALTNFRATIVSDADNFKSDEAQTAAITTALLIARSGGRVQLCVPDMPLRGAQPPLSGDSVLPAAYDYLNDLIPGVDPVAPEARVNSDLLVLIGDSPLPASARATRVVRVSGDAWRGELADAYTGGGARWLSYGSPFGALACGGLAAVEGFKLAIMRFGNQAANRATFAEMFAQARCAAVALARAGTPPPAPGKWNIDAISAGAIVQSSLFALSRVSQSEWLFRLFEPEASELTNINRYAFLRRSRLGILKVADLAELAGVGRLGSVGIEPVPARYDDLLASTTNLANQVIVGVDDIPTRWRVQRQSPPWLGVGATSHWSAMVTTHGPTLPACAGCAHPYDDNAIGAIPTISFVSHWAGLFLASRLVQALSGVPVVRAEQLLYLSTLRLDGAGYWSSPLAIHSHCPVHRAA